MERRRQKWKEQTRWKSRICRFYGKGKVCFHLKAGRECPYLHPDIDGDKDEGSGSWAEEEAGDGDDATEETPLVPSSSPTPKWKGPVPPPIKGAGKGKWKMPSSTSASASGDDWSSESWKRGYADEDTDTQEVIKRV